MKKIILSFVIFASITSLAQNQTNAPEINSIAKANNQFAFDLYAKMSEKEKGNLFYSPFSLSSALAMTYAGAGSTTALEMGKVLHFQPNSPVFHQNFGAYLAKIAANAEGNIEFEIANRIWVEQSVKFEEEFLERIKESYSGGVEKANFIANYEATRVLINAWVEQKTKERIKDLIPKGILNSDTRMVLVNAIYFKGDWLHPFDSLDTKDDVFHVGNGKDITAKFMHQTGHFKYADGESCKMIQVPYQGGKQSMIIALPHGFDDLDATEKELQRDGFERLKNASQRLIQLKFPKFRMTMPLVLKEYFRALGMKTPFEDSANFSQMTKEQRLYISEIIHKAFVEVDEKGTEAAAATAVVMAVTASASFEITYEIPFVADHPFLYYIIDNETNAILFMGRMCEPKIN